MQGLWRFLLMGAMVGITGAVLGGTGACYSEGNIGDDCGPNVSARCCPCPFPEDCPGGPKPIPWDCPNACLGPAPLPPKCFDAGDDGGDAGDAGMSGLCAGGVCVPSAPDGWKAVAFVSSWGKDPPTCPADAPIVAFEGTTAPPAPKCGACSCEAPEGTCSLPEKWTVNSAACPGGGVKTNFDPPVAWDGSCTEDKAIPLGLTCNGVPCVRSITIAPPVITEEPCKSVTIGEPEDAPPKVWNGGPETPVGLACASDKSAPTCTGQAGSCIPGGSAFSACLMKEGDLVCPAGWDDRHLLYGEVVDARECSACSCGAPSGGTCKVKWRTFAAAGCMAENLASDVYAGMVPPCLDYMPGVALAGKTAEVQEYTKGTCAPSGGDVTGELLLNKPATVCCYAPAM